MSPLPPSPGPPSRPWAVTLSQAVALGPRLPQHWPAPEGSRKVVPSTNQSLSSCRPWVLTHSKAVAQRPVLSKHWLEPEGCTNLVPTYTRSWLPTKAFGVHPKQGRGLRPKAPPALGWHLKVAQTSSLHPPTPGPEQALGSHPKLGGGPRTLLSQHWSPHEGCRTRKVSWPTTEA